MTAVPNPYRETDNTPPAPLEELAWRRRVARSARWAKAALWGELPVVVAALWPHLVLPAAVLGVVLAIVATVATWRATAPRTGGRVDWRGWMLRGSVPVFLGVYGLRVFAAQLLIASLVAGAVLLIAAGPYFGTRRSHEHRESLLRSRSVFGVWMLSWLFLLPWPGMGYLFPLGAVLLVNAAEIFGGLRTALLPGEHQFWFDSEMEPPGEWVSLFVYQDGQVEVWCTDEMLGSFRTKGEALEWLAQDSYLPAERALAQHLVDRVPPDTLPRVKPRRARTRRNKRRVRDDEPRVRVAAEAEAIDREADNVGEPALDEAESPRAAAVRRADE